MSKTSVIILTNEPQKYIEEILKYLPVSSDNIILDTSPGPEFSLAAAKKYGARVISFPPEQFNHGGTRNFGLNEAKGDIVVFLTQDSVPEAGAVEKLANVFTNNDVAVAYGRQIPSKDATPFAAHARLFNYPPVSYLRGYSSKGEFGIKAVFNSNSFSAYRKKALLAAGGFPEDAILSEDMVAAVRLLKNGFKIAYVSEARAYHSHNYGICKEFRRYFDIGVFHEKESWILSEFGNAEGEGFNFVLSELKYLRENGYWYLIFGAFVRNLFKYAGYFCGRHYKLLPLPIIKIFTMNKAYWDRRKAEVGQ